jgi:hypothetical protein
MATAATVKQVQVRQTKPRMVKASLEDVYEALVKILQPHAPPFRTDVPCMSGGKPSFQLTVPKPVAIPGAYGGKPVDLHMAAVILQKGYVGFYLMWIYMNDATKKRLSPAPLKPIEAQDMLPCEDVGRRSAQGHPRGAGLGTKVYRERGWL